MNQPNIPDQNKPNTKNGSLSIDRIKSWYRALPDKKRYIEFVTALLTVPVLITVLISNFNSLKNNEKSLSNQRL